MMNVFNQIFVVVTSLCVGIAGAVLLLVASGVVEARDLKINTADVERIVEEAAREVRGVTNVRPGVQRKGDGIIASLRASLEPGVMISDAAPQIEGKIRSAVESQTGLTVSAVRLNLEEAHQTERAPAEVTSR